MRVVFFDLTLWRLGFQRYEHGLAVDLGPWGLWFPESPRQRIARRLNS